jgi:hypothetical protein
MGDSADRAELLRRLEIGGKLTIVSLRGRPVERRFIVDTGKWEH